MSFPKSLGVVFVLSGTVLAQQPDRAAVRQQAMALLTQAREVINTLPPGIARRGVLDGISVTLFQIGDESGSAAALNEAISVEKQYLAAARNAPQRPSPSGGYVQSGTSQSVRNAVRAAGFHAVAGDRTGARAWINVALENAPLVTAERERVPVMNEVAKAQIAIGDLDAAQQTVQTIGGKNSLPTDRLADIAAAKAHAGNIAAAKLMTTGQDETATAAILEKVAEEQAVAKDFASALETASSIGSKSTDTTTKKVEALLAIAEAQSKSGDEAGASASYARAVRVAANRQFFDRLVALSEARTGRFEEALRLTGTSSGTSAMDCMELAVLAGNAKRPDIARQLLSRARAAIEADLAKDSESVGTTDAAGHPVDRKQDNLQILAIAQAQAGDIAGGLQTARALDETHRSYALGGIASEEARRGDIAGAEKTLAEDTERHTIPPELAQAKARAGDFEGAFQMARRGMPNGEIETVFRTYCKLAVLEKCTAAASVMTFPLNKALALVGMAENLLGTTRPLLPELQRRLDRNEFDPNR